jgi:hypothetical protein
MATRIYPLPKPWNADATAAWFRRQMAAHPRLFQSRRVPIWTLPSRERHVSAKAGYQAPRSQAEDAPGWPIDINGLPSSQGLTGQAHHFQTEIPVMAAAEVIHWLRRCRHDRSRGRFPIARIAAMSGLHRATLYRAMTGDVSVETCAALTPVLRAVAENSIGFERRHRVWEPVGHYDETGSVIWQDRMVAAADWQPGGHCRSCSERGRYVLVKIDGRGELFICDRCIGETDRRMMGAVDIVTRSRRK